MDSSTSADHTTSAIDSSTSVEHTTSTVDTTTSVDVTTSTVTSNEGVSSSSVPLPCEQAQATPFGNGNFNQVPSIHPWELRATLDYDKSVMKQGADFRIAGPDGGTYIALDMALARYSYEFIFRNKIETTCVGAAYDIYGKAWLDPTRQYSDNPFYSVAMQWFETCAAEVENPQYIDVVDTHERFQFNEYLYSDPEYGVLILQGSFHPTSNKTNLRLMINRGPQAEPGGLIVKSLEMSLGTAISDQGGGDLGVIDALRVGWTLSVEKGDTATGATGAFASGYPSNQAPKQNPNKWADSSAGYHLRCNRPASAPANSYSWARISFDAPVCLGKPYTVTITAPLIYGGEGVSDPSPYFVVQQGSEAPYIASDGASSQSRWQKPLTAWLDTVQGPGNPFTFTYTPDTSTTFSMAIVCPPGAGGKIAINYVDVAPVKTRQPPFSPILPSPTSVTPVQCPPATSFPFKPVPLTEYAYGFSWSKNNNDGKCDCNILLDDTSGTNSGPWQLQFTTSNNPFRTEDSKRSFAQYYIRIDEPDLEYKVQVRYDIVDGHKEGLAEIKAQWRPPSCDSFSPTIFIDIPGASADRATIQALGSEDTGTFEGYFKPAGAKAITLQIVVDNDDTKAEASVLFKSITLTQQPLRLSSFADGLQKAWTHEKLLYNTDTKDYITPFPDPSSGYTADVIQANIVNTRGIKLSCGRGTADANILLLSSISTITSLNPAFYTLKIKAVKGTDLAGSNVWLLVQQGDAKPYMDNDYDPTAPVSNVVARNYHGYTYVNGWYNPDYMADQAQPVEFTVTKVYAGTGDSKLTISIVCGAGSSGSIFIESITMGLP